MKPTFITGLPAHVTASEPAPSAAPGAVTVVWTLRRATDLAQCLLYTLGDRIEFHIRMTDEIVVSQHCSGLEHAQFVANLWWSALVARGWNGESESNSAC
jgi:hypothetical protein